MDIPFYAHLILSWSKVACQGLKGEDESVSFHGRRWYVKGLNMRKNAYLFMVGGGRSVA